MKGCPGLTGLDKCTSILFPFKAKSCNILPKDMLKGARDGKIGSNPILANALSALSPKEREEKRHLDAILLAMPR
jgi:hypothetical protein